MITTITRNNGTTIQIRTEGEPLFQEDADYIKICRLSSSSTNVTFITGLVMSGCRVADGWRISVGKMG